MGEDDVVKQDDVKHLGSVADAVCHTDIGMAWLWTVRGVVVGDNNLCSKQFNGSLDDDFVVYCCRSHAPLADSHLIKDSA